MQIGNEKMRIDGFSWKADLDVDMSLANPLSGLAKGTNFQITRGVDAATAGLLGSAVAVRSSLKSGSPIAAWWLARISSPWSGDCTTPSLPALI